MNTELKKNENVVKRLREGIVLLSSIAGGIGGVRIEYDMRATNALMVEAADEIENLRREIDEAMALKAIECQSMMEERDAAETKVRVLRGALIKIAESGCEGGIKFGHCDEVLGVELSEYCLPCYANHALSSTPTNKGGQN